MITFIQYNCFVCGIVLFFLSHIIHNTYTPLLLSVLLLWANNVLFSLRCMQRLFLFFFANITFFIFLLGRVTVAFLFSDNYIKSVTFSVDSDVWTGLSLLSLALFFLFIGAWYYEMLFSSRKNSIPYIAATHQLWRDSFVNSVRIISFTMYAISLFFSCLTGFEKVRFMQSHTYVDYYIVYSRQLPIFVYAIASFCHYSLCFFLAAAPDKKCAAVAITAYVISTIPDLIVGGRSSTVLALFLGLIYYMMRDYYNSGGQIWLGKTEKRLIVITIPLLLIFLSAYQYVRMDREIAFSPLELFFDFFYSQGGSFGWLCSGLGVLDKLPNGVVSYTFGGFIDYVFHSRVADMLWGGSFLGDGNNVLHATLGNSMSHHLSYILLGGEYLNGYGVGSSYLLEVFADYGCLGVAIFCLVLGYLIAYAPRLAQRGVIWYSIILIATKGILIMPRADAMAPFKFLIHIQFLFPFAVCFGYSLLLSSSIVHSYKRRYSYIKAGTRAMPCRAKERSLS